ncbi:hypothetical protein SAMN04487897_104159 [Paenibacillus sp. yr247]|nr:hypothetical protein SAMN04487897_104159 [Paenibacillus sp. yr247]
MEARAGADVQVDQLFHNPASSRTNTIFKYEVQQELERLNASNNSSCFIVRRLITGFNIHIKTRVVLDNFFYNLSWQFECSVINKLVI